MERNLIVLAHALPGIIGLALGLGVLKPPRPGDGRAWMRWLYTACVAALLLFLVTLVITDWTTLDATAQIAFGGLVVLGAVMGIRLAAAHREAITQATGWEGRYIQHVYFTYISLWIGFLIVPAINSPLPALFVPMVVVGALIVGGTLVSRFKKRVIGTAAGTAP
ncbi:MAG: hypothetical protein GEU79_06635 [Acidimicrobiia bacterium]|nr:hypothetical protein [Acidimicrobiia bacterium]